MNLLKDLCLAFAIAAIVLAVALNSVGALHQ